MADELNAPVDTDVDDEEIIEDLEEEEEVAFIDDGIIVDEEDDDVDDDTKKNPLDDELEQLKLDKKNLNIALHQARQERKKKSTETEEEVLTDTQLQEILAEHKDDPEVMLNVVKYMSQKTTKDQTDVAQVAETKAQYDSYVLDRWPDMRDETSELSQHVAQSKLQLQIDNHPMGDYLALGASILEELPNLQKASYEQGVADSKNGTVETKRKEKIKSNTLTPSGKKTVVKGSIPASSLKTAKQMGLTPSQFKIYQKRILKMKENK